MDPERQTSAHTVKNSKKDQRTEKASLGNYRSFDIGKNLKAKFGKKKK